MNRKHSWSPLILLVVWALVLGSASALTATEDQTPRVGKKGDVTFKAETAIGDVTLKPGRYFFQHGVVGDDHFVHFTEVTKPLGKNAGGFPVSHPGDIKCRLEPLDRKARQTIIIYAATEGGTQRITRIVIKGENVAHVFD